MTSPSRNTSPVDLLWGYQLKLQHSHLLQRIKELEASNKVLQERTETSSRQQSSVNHDAQIADLLRRIIDCENDKSELRTSIARLKGQQDAGQAANQHGYDTIRGLLTALEERCQQQESKQVDYLQRVEAINSRLDTMTSVIHSHDQKAAEKVLKKTDLDVKVINRRLEAVEAQKIQDSTSMTTLSERLAALEQANVLLKQQNKKLVETVRLLNGGPLYDQPTVSRQTPHPTSSPFIAQQVQSPLVAKQARRGHIMKTKRKQAKAPAKGATEALTKTQSKATKLAGVVSEAGMQERGPVENTAGTTAGKRPRARSPKLHVELDSHVDTQLEDVVPTRTLPNRGTKRTCSNMQAGTVSDKLNGERPIKYRRRIILTEAELAALSP